MSIIRTKREMYRLLSSGALGNTVQQWFTLGEWLYSPEMAQFPLWGIRSGVAGGDKRMQLNVPTEEVVTLYQQWFPSGGGNISPMIDRYAVLRGEVFESDFGEPFGLNLFYVPPGKIVAADPWRGSFREYGTRAWGLRALHLLRYHLWPSDYEDLLVLLDTYPGHVIEFSACDRAVGVIPHRNTICWECRKY